VTQSQVVVVSISSGSVIADIQLSPSSDTSVVTANALAQQLITLSSDPDSVLFRLPIFASLQAPVVLVNSTTTTS